MKTTVRIKRKKKKGQDRKIYEKKGKFYFKIFKISKQAFISPKKNKIMQKLRNFISWKKN